MNYTGISNEDISKEISWRVARKRLYDKTIQIEATAPIHSLYADYYSSWANIGPLINEAYITISRDSCQAHVSSYFNPSFVISCNNTDKGVLRAAAIVWLMVDDEKRRG